MSYSNTLSYTTVDTTEITPTVLRTPSVLAENQVHKVNLPLTYGVFLLYPVRALIVGPYANSLELSYIIPTPWTPSSLARYQLRNHSGGANPTMVNQPSACCLFLLYVARALMVGCTPLLYPTPWTPSSLALDKILGHSRGAARSLCSCWKSAPSRLTSLRPVLFSYRMILLIEPYALISLPITFAAHQPPPAHRSPKRWRCNSLLDKLTSFGQRQSEAASHTA